ncbi:MAG: 50S ribosomal protein L28 [Patescibacteria group bacterium]|jgi:large subunit ribosomal protein L28|nr:50S ribosomal protein L28 [Patescibacteria group bacterium]
MARVCYFTGRGTQTGNNRSHSMRATRRTFKVNLINKWVKLEDGSRVRVKINSKLYKKFKGFL